MSVNGYAQQDWLRHVPRQSGEGGSAASGEEATAISLSPDLAAFLAQMTGGAAEPAPAPSHGSLAHLNGLLRQLEDDFATLVSDLTGAPASASAAAAATTTAGALMQQLEDDFATLIADITGAAASSASPDPAPSNDLAAAAKAFFSDLQTVLTHYDATPRGAPALDPPLQRAAS